AAQARGHELERRRRERAVERLELRDVADALGVRAGAVAEERGVPGQRPHQPERDLAEGRLPAAVGPDDREEPAPRQVERDVLEHGRLREAHGDAVEVQRGQVARRPRVAAVAAPAGARSRRGLLRRSRLRTGSHSGDANSRERPPEATRRTLRQGWRARGTAGEPPPPAPAQRWLGLLGLTKTVGSSWRIALALSHTRCGLPSTQIVLFWRFGLTVRLWTPTCLRPTPPLRLAEPLRVLVCCDFVFLPVTAQTRGMSSPPCCPARSRCGFARGQRAGIRPQNVTG